MDTLAPPRAAETPPAPPTTARRIDAIDIARGLALIGMLIVHVPYETMDRSAFWEWMLTSPGGRASVLFFVLSGVSLSIINGRRSPSAEPSVLVKRGVVLFLFGTLMSSFWYSTILPHYGVMFMLAPLLLRRTWRFLVPLVAVALLVGPVLNVVFQYNLMNFAASHSEAPVSAWVLMTLNSVLFDLYPLVLWIGFFVLGVLIGRRDLRRRATGARLLVAGVVLTLAATGAIRATADVAEGPDQGGSVSGQVAGSGSSIDATGLEPVPIDGSGSSAMPEFMPGGTEKSFTWEAPHWRSLLSGEPHADTTLWALQAIGVASGIIGALILLPARLVGRLGPLRRLGTISLTAYVVHTFLVQDLWTWLGPIAPNSFAWELGRVGIAIGLLLFLAWFVTRRWTQGPLEWSLHQLTRSLPSGRSTTMRSPDERRTSVG